MKTNLLLIVLSFFIWQSITIVSTLYKRLDARTTQVELLIQRLDDGN